jgi:hypothetical protein
MKPTVQRVMQNLTKIRSFALAFCSVAALALAAPAFAQQAGVVVVRGGGYPGGYYVGYRGGYFGGYRGYYGYRSWYGGYYPWGWGGPGPGLYFATLPYYYGAYGYGGMPYYYAGNTYLLRDPTVAQYRTATPPAGTPNQFGGQASSELIVYPKGGQSQYQQSVDRYECYRWSVSQLGYDPTSAGGGTVRRDLTDYNRAQTACLTARGYSVT